MWDCTNSWERHSNRMPGASMYFSWLLSSSLCLWVVGCLGVVSRVLWVWVVSSVLGFSEGGVGG